MCRIAGIISRRLTGDERRQKAHSMCVTQLHGGPDDGGLFSDERAGLVFGHRRLSILDLSPKGHQPMADVCQKAWITFNGEIYNYLELKQELVTCGALFHSETDTEVIIQAYLFWGTQAFARIQGMFAFGLFDVEKQLTYLVRGSGGIKPLYYHIDDDQLSFASEVRALNIAGIATGQDERWVVRLLAYGHIPEPFTTLKKVFSLAKSNYLEWNHATNTYIIKAFDTSNIQRREILDIGEAMSAINTSLKQSVKRQLIADAPIGVFLSGGVDSSIITLLAAQQKEQQLKTISVYFDEKSYDERAYQNLVLKRISGEKFTHLVKQEDFDDHFPRIMAAMDMPTTDGINSWFISMYARQDGLKAVLSGLGADELFGGYPSFKRIKYLGYLRKFPVLLYNLMSIFPADRYRKISFLAQQHHLADYLLLRGIFTPADIAKILDMRIQEVNTILFDDVPDIELGPYNEEQASWFESNLYMQNQLLRDTDVMSMSQGLEVRVPFLDETLQQVVRCILPSIRFNRQQPKKLLIDTFRDILPEAVMSRSKMGFTFPLQQWMKENPQISEKGLYKGKAAQEIFERFQTNQMHWSKVFALYQIQAYV